MRKASEIRSLEAEQLAAEELRLRAALYEQRNKASRGKPEKTHEVSETRRELAKVLTVMRERALGRVSAAPQAQGEA